MFATLVSNSVATPIDNVANKRIRDIIKVYCGEITTVGELDSTVWETTICSITNTVAANFTRIYCSTDFDNLAATNSWYVYLKKSSAVAGKDITFKLVRDVSEHLGIYAGNFLANGSESNVVASVSYLGHTLQTAGAKYVIGTGASGLFSCFSANIGFGIERTHYPYDKNSAENLGVSGNIASSPGAVYVSNIYNPKLQNYVAYSPNLKIADSGAVSVTRDANGQVALPFIPMYIESYENGWAGGNLSTNSGLYRTADNYGKTGDSVIKDGKTYRVLQVAATSLRYLALDE